MPEKRRPGRPTTSGISGPKSYYQASTLILTINSILQNSEAKTIIHKYLLDTGTLFRFYLTVGLKTLYYKKENNLEAIKFNREIVKLPNIKNELEFDKKFHQDSIKLNKMDKKQIKQEAQIWATITLSRLTADDLLWLYPIGAISYYANLLNNLFIFSCPLPIDD